MVGARSPAVDFLFDPFPIVVEVSADRGHATDSERRATPNAATCCRTSVRHVFEYTYQDVMRRPAFVVAAMRARLTDAGWVL